VAVALGRAAVGGVRGPLVIERELKARHRRVIRRIRLEGTWVEKVPPLER
jgi:hypothetical protein